MTVTDLHVATLRAQLAHRFDEHRRMFAQLSRESFDAGYRPLVAAVFFEAVDKRFANKETTVNDVVEYVAGIREGMAESDDLDPVIGERMIRVALGDDSVSVVDVDGGAQFMWQAVLAASLVADENYDDEELDRFLREARTLAEHWSSAG